MSNNKETTNWQFIYKLLGNYFNNKANEKEREIIETWNPDIEQITDISDKEIDDERIATFNIIAKKLAFKQKQSERKKMYSIRRLSVAASILIIISLGTTFLSNRIINNKAEWTYGLQNKKILQATDKVKTIVMPDGTRISLNSGSSISYSQSQYNKKNREISLDGEAFFEVTKNPNKPFIIHTGEMTTTVRGTSFNVKAYPQLNKNVVTVCTGKVEVSNNNKILAMLTPNKQLVYNYASKTSETMTVDANEMAGWIKGLLVLNNADVNELKLQTMQYYKVNLVFENDMENIMFNSVFAKGTPIEDVVKTICSVYGLKYSRRTNTEYYINK